MDASFTKVWVVKRNFDFYYDDAIEDAPEDLNENGESAVSTRRSSQSSSTRQRCVGD